MATTTRTSRRSVLLVLLLSALLLLQFIEIGSAGNNRHNSQYLYDHTIPGQQVSDSMPHYAWKKINDSLERLEQYQKNKQRYLDKTMQFGPIGYAKNSGCDTCSSSLTDKMSTRITSYYFLLDGYWLDDNSVFTAVNGKNMLKYPVWDSVVDGTRTGHYEKKEISIRFLDKPSQKKVDKPGTPGSVLIPVSKSTYFIISVLVTILFVASSILGLYILLFLPFGTLVAIATGKIFTKSNINNLLFMGWSFIGLFVALPLIGWLFTMIFSNSIPKEIHFPFWQSLLSNKSLLIAGVILLLLANAFKSGYKLKQEQDLTV